MHGCAARDARSTTRRRGFTHIVRASLVHAGARWCTAAALLVQRRRPIHPQSDREDPVRAIWTIAGAALAVAACSTNEKPAAGDSAATTAATPANAGANAGASADPDRATAGGGVPAGYVGRTDREGVDIAGAKYAANGGRWEVTTGPAHIVYAAKDSASGTYTATASFDQLEAPRHP